MNYRPRFVDRDLTLRLASAGAVVVGGPKARGKTVTRQRMAANEVLLDVDEERDGSQLRDGAEAT